MKISVLAGTGPSTAILLNWLLGHGYDDLHLVLEARPSRMRQLRQRARRWGWRRTVGQAAFMAGIVPLLRSESARRRAEVLAAHGLSDVFPSVPHRIDVRTVNDPVVTQHLRRRRPAVVLVNGTRIIRTNVLSAYSGPFINTHTGITPQYRGVHGGYWALRSGEPENFGVTLHLVDEGVDTGGILAQRTVTPTDQDNFETYPLLQQIASFEALRDILNRIERGEGMRTHKPSAGLGRQWPHPTLIEYVKGRLQGVK